MTHGWAETYIVEPSIDVPALAACTIAFCSACIARQSSCLSPEGTFNFCRKHPVSSQCRHPTGAPLYPVANILLSLTITAPTLRLKQVERVLTRWTTCMKYSSHEGLSIILYQIICLRHRPIPVQCKRYHSMSGLHTRDICLHQDDPCGLSVCPAVLL